MVKPCSLFWFRRDLRLQDNRGFFEALSGDLPVLPIFIFDKNILEKLPSEDHRVDFIQYALLQMHAQLTKNGSGLHTFYGDPATVFQEILKKYSVKKVYTNHDYEPSAIKRDSEIGELLAKNNIDFATFKDQVIFEKDEVLKDDGKFYSVYTPYSRKWLENFKSQKLLHYNSEKKLKNLVQSKGHMLTHLDIGFKKSDIAIPKKAITNEILTKYPQQRDIPVLDATSHVGVHLRFGTVSIRDLVRKAVELKAQVWLSELIWREFFMQILFHNPRVVDEPFKQKYSKIKWRNNLKEFKTWCEGRTGYPLVDAGMRELNATGHMHNRVRMITASFLIKHLLIDWRWGEKYFAEKLFDFDLASNNGNWQWVAGCGCDAAPYFRIFNPQSQQEKFDPDFKYIKRWVPEFGSNDYPEPIVEQKLARIRVLKAFQVVK